MSPAEDSPPQRTTPFAVRLWFGWAFGLLALTGILLPRVVAFVDFSERAPFSLLGIFVVLELALVLFGITVALQRKRIAHRFAVGIAVLPVPILAGLPPAVLRMPPAAANGWYLLFVPVGAILSVVLIFGLTRPASRAWFSED
jgi:hypothetical protein